MSALVSVITTVYNTERFLDEAVRSVVGQCYSNWELIIIDDGSSDGSVRIAREWSKRDARIRYANHPGNCNLGISASRNLGISQAIGDLIAFLDADDVWLPGKLSLQVDDITSLPDIGMTFSAAERWYSWDETQPGAKDFVVESAIPGWGADRVLPPSVLLDAFLKNESLTPCTCTVLVRRQCVLDVGGFESAFRGLYDDQVFYAKVLLANPVYVSSKCFARYRQHESSCCGKARKNGNENQERGRFLNWLATYKEECVRLR